MARPDAPGVAALGESRARVLTVLQALRRPAGVDEVAAEVGLHTNTTRFHLDGLVTAGLAERITETREVPGRPRALYSAAADSPRAGRRSYQLLAEILTSYLAHRTKQPEHAALEAGQAWGRFLAERPEPFRRIDATAATAQLVGTLADIGFEPEPVTAGRKRQIHLHHCPFRETAEAHREVVCAIHLGLMRGLLDEIDAPVDAERLDPFVTPTLCVAHLSARSRQRGRT
jgi:predicted ArsR family transcriptional regulator